MLVNKPCVLVFGATGLFGELLVRRLADANQFAVIGVARNKAPLEKLQLETGIFTEIIDRENEQSVALILSQLKPFAVIDCAGPFQYYGDDPYRLARQVIQAGCHYIDIADATSFVVSISELDELARRNKVLAISGASTVPAINAAVADKLTSSLPKVISIETAIVPGNRAKRTLSVMKAILGQIGQPYQLTRHGTQQTVYGWSDTRKIDLAIPVDNPVQGRLASLVNTPDTSIFPERYNAETVGTYAGIELKTFHRTLQFAGRLVRTRLLPSLAPFTRIARFIASGFEQTGSDIGGMQVSVVAENNRGKLLKRTWDLVASDGRGPEIPTLPVSVILDKLLHRLFEPGARHSCGEITLENLQPYFESIGAETAITEEELQPIFKRCLGDAFNNLPEAVQAFHNTAGQTIYKGRAESLGPTGISGRLAAFIIGFPGANKDIPVEVTTTADSTSEFWCRSFAGSVFNSRLSLHRDGYITERFNPLTMRLGLHVKDHCLHYPVTSAKLFGLIPLPRILLPKSIAHESVDSKGRFTFDVHLQTPFGARISHYRGYLVKDQQAISPPADQHLPSQRFHPSDE